MCSKTIYLSAFYLLCDSPRSAFMYRRFGTLCPIFTGRVRVPHDLWRWKTKDVPKRREIKFIRQGITQKKEHNIYNAAKVGNQEFNFYLLFIIPALSAVLYITQFLHPAVILFFVRPNILPGNLLLIFCPSPPPFQHSRIKVCSKGKVYPFCSMDCKSSQTFASTTLSFPYLFSFVLSFLLERMLDCYVINWTWLHYRVSRYFHDKWRTGRTRISVFIPIHLLC